MNDLSPGSASTIADSGRQSALFTAAEFMQVCEAAAAFDMRLELADGALERMSPPSDDHGRHQSVVMSKLVLALGEAGGGLLRIEVAVRLDDATVRVPDLMLLREAGRVTGARDPATLLLAIEVAESSLDYDLGRKRLEYARAAIPNYWVVDGQARLTHVFGNPDDGDYLESRKVSFAKPLHIPGLDAAIILG